MNWMLFAAKIPTLIQGAMQIVETVKNAKGKEKKDAVIASIPTSIALTEFGIGKDIINDPVVAKLISAYIDAEAAAMKAKDALQQGILTKTAEITP